MATANARAQRAARATRAPTRWSAMFGRPSCARSVAPFIRLDILHAAVLEQEPESPIRPHDSATSRGRSPRKALQILSCKSPNGMAAYSSPDRTSRGLTYSWAERSVPLRVAGVTNTTARIVWPLSSVGTAIAGGRKLAYGSSPSVLTPGVGVPICAGTPWAMTSIHSQPVWSSPWLGNWSRHSVA